MRKIILFSAIAIFALAIAGCSIKDEAPVLINNGIIGTWKCIGFGNTRTDKVKLIEPNDCDKCYVITFRKDGTFSGHSNLLPLSGNYKIENNNVTLSNLNNYFIYEIGEFYDGNNFRATFRSVESVDISKPNLKLYYSKVDYLLFKFKAK